MCTAVGPESFVKHRHIQVRTNFDFEVAILGSKRSLLGSQRQAESTRSTPQLRQAVFSLLLTDSTVCSALCPATNGSHKFDDASLIALAKIIVDDLHIHRLRQICIIIQEKLGTRFGLPDSEEVTERPLQILIGAQRDAGAAEMPMPPGAPANG